MPVVTTRPDATLQLGSWTVTGAATAHAALSDELDTTYVSHTSRCRLDNQVLKLQLGDISIPTGSKIFSVQMRVRVWRNTTTSQPLCILILVSKIIRASFTLNVTSLVKLVLSFLLPRVPVTSVWTTFTQPALLQHPDGGEWTQASFNAFEYHLGRESTGTTLQVSAVYADVNYNEQPVGTPTGPTGTITDTTRPLVTWTYSDPESDRQEQFQVRVFNSAQYTAGGFDPLTAVPVTESGWTKGEDLSWTVNKDLVNATYRAYLQVQQVWGGLGAHRSVVAFTGWTQNVPGPGTPTLNGTYEASLNRVRLDLAAGPSPATETYDIECSDDAGLTWGYIRGGRQVVPAVGGTATVYDYEAPLNLSRRYRVQAFRTLGTIKVGSSYSNTVDVVPASYSFWLKDPLSPSLNMVLPLGEDEFSRPRSEGVFKPLVADGRQALAVVVSGPIYGREGKWELLFPATTRYAAWEDGQTAWDKFAAIRFSGRVLLWQLPTGEQCYVALSGELATTWDVRLDAAKWRRASISYVEVDRPTDDTTTA